MANEFRHADVGPDLSQAEWTAVNGHIANNQARGDSIGFDGTTWVRVAERFDVKLFGALGDGAHDDTDAIIAAIAALPAGGGTIFFPPGTYNTTALVQLLSKTGVRLTGQGASSVISSTAANAAIGLNGCTDCQVDHLSITGGVYGVLVENSSTRITLDHLKVTATIQDDLIQVLASTDITITNCNCSNGYKNGITITNVDRAIIQGNVCNSNAVTTHATPSWGIVVSAGCTRWTVANNVCIGNHDGGISIDETPVGGGSTDAYGTVSGNTCADSVTYHGISVGGTDYVTVSGNNCYGNASCGIISTGDHIAVTGNTCVGNTASGIMTSQTAPNYSNYCTIVGNTCNGNTVNGLNLDRCQYSSIEANTCAANGQQGIVTTSTSHCRIGGNVCAGNSQTTDNTYHNIYICSDYNLIAGNVCRDGGGTNQSQYGIAIVGATSSILVGNDCYDGGRAGAIYDGGTGTVFGAGNRQTISEGTAVQQIVGWVNHATTNPSLGTLPAGVCVTAVRIQVTEAFNSDGTDEITVGYDADPDAYATATDVSTTGIKSVTAGVVMGYSATERAVEAYYTAGGSAPSTGTALVTLEYYHVPYAPA